jgi:phospholipid/cholesterol/gamma-HCH transport system permease protein
MFEQVAALGERTTDLVNGLGRITVFFAQTLAITFAPPFRFRRFVTELYTTGVLSLSIICVSGAAVGMVLGLQGYRTLSRYGAAESLGSAVAITLITELGPVLTALLVAGRAGSAMAGEIGSMVATEQIDGLRMMSMDPIDFVISPKMAAMISVMPLLSALFICFGLFGGYLAGVELLGVDGGSYISGMQESIQFDDEILMSFIKALLFGAIVGAIACYRGYHSEPNVEGVSRATTAAVVASSVSVLIADYFVTALWHS